MYDMISPLHLHAQHIHSFLSEKQISMQISPTDAHGQNKQCKPLKRLGVVTHLSLHNVGPKLHLNFLTASYYESCPRVRDML